MGIPETGGARRPPRPPAVYALADVDTLGEAATPGAVKALAEAGVRWIQIRAKSTPDDRLYHLVEQCFEALEAPPARDHPEAAAPVALWMDDRADLAALFPFAGLHLGQRDLPPAAARRVVGEGTWIGSSCHDEAELEAAVDDPEVDVVAVGPVYPTTGKADPEPVVGLEFVERARRAVRDAGKALVAIGGIDAGRLPAVLAAGADGAAVLGAICRPEDPAAVGRAGQRLLVASETASETTTRPTGEGSP